jgi:hypothetical protein
MDTSDLTERVLRVLNEVRDELRVMKQLVGETSAHVDQTEALVDKLSDRESPLEGAILSLRAVTAEIRELAQRP